MKFIVHLLTGLIALVAVPSAAFAQTAQQHVETGLQLWVWIAIAAAFVIVLALVVARRRRPTQAIIKTRLG